MSQKPPIVELLLYVNTVCIGKVLMACSAESVFRLESCDFLLVTSRCFYLPQKSSFKYKLSLQNAFGESEKK